MADQKLMLVIEFDTDRDGDTDAKVSAGIPLNAAALPWAQGLITALDAVDADAGFDGDGEIGPVPVPIPLAKLFGVRFSKVVNVTGRLLLKDIAVEEEVAG